jgi:ribonuclease-3
MDEQERAALEQRLGHRFQDEKWLSQAITHRSRRMENSSATGDNERLEFLGDRVLGLVVSRALFTEFAEWEVRMLSNGIAKLVSAPSLERAARGLELGQHLQLGRGEELTGGRAKRNLLSDAYEALVGAVFMDAGLEAAEGFIRRTLLDAALAENLGALCQPDDKSALQELLQERKGVVPQYVVTRETGPDHRKTFEVAVWVGNERLASGKGMNKKEAELAAARQALGRLRAEPRE